MRIFGLYLVALFFWGMFPCLIAAFVNKKTNKGLEPAQALKIGFLTNLVTVSLCFACSFGAFTWGDAGMNTVTSFLMGGVGIACVVAPVIVLTKK